MGTALLSLLTCVVVGTAACSGTRVSSAVPTPTAKVTGTPSPVFPEAPAPTTAAAPSAAAVVARYYQAIVAQNYPLAFTYIDADATGPNGQKLTLSALLQLAHTMDSE